MRYNGNYDFSLSVTQYSREPKLKIQFKRPTPATTGRVKLTVYNPYGRIMFKEEYYVSKNERKTVDVTLPLGKYKVEVSAVKGGELYDWINEYVRLGDYIKYDHTISSDELKELYYHRSIEKSSRMSFLLSES